LISGTDRPCFRTDPRRTAAQASLERSVAQMELLVVVDVGVEE
jgi:hypothetical protein